MMRGSVAVVLAALLLQASAQQYQTLDLGNQLVRDFTQYFTLPTNTGPAQQQGWSVFNGTCDPNLGIAWTVDPSGPIRSKPMTLYFTPAGQVAGVGVRIFGEVKPNLLNLGYFKYVSDSEYDITVTFRSSAEICDFSYSSHTLGDRLIINADTIAQEIPLTTAEAVQAGFTKGSCFFGMGHHYFLDLATGPQMSWLSANMLPIVPMYNNGTINAFFFASTDVQQQLTSTNWWEKVPLPNFLMCKNWCDDSCTFNDTHFWSTLHIYMNDYQQVTCADGCKMHCCP